MFIQTDDTAGFITGKKHDGKNAACHKTHKVSDTYALIHPNRIKGLASSVKTGDDEGA